MFTAALCLSPDSDGGGLFGINAQRGKSMLGANYARFLKMYMKNTNYQEFIGAVATGVQADQNAAAHALKGVTANLCLDEINHCIVAMEMDTKSGRLIAADDPRLAQLREIQEKTLASIQRVLDDPSCLQ